MQLYPMFAELYANYIFIDSEDDFFLSPAYLLDVTVE